MATANAPIMTAAEYMASAVHSLPSNLVEMPLASANR